MLGSVLSLFLLGSQLPLVERLFQSSLIHDEKVAQTTLKQISSQKILEPEATCAALDYLSSKGEEKALLALWEAYYKSDPDSAMQQEPLEALGWGFLRAGMRSSQQSNRIITLIGSAMTQDRFAVPLILQALKSSSITSRLVAVQLCPLLRDHELIEELIEMATKESNLRVRVEVIKALGALHSISMEDEWIARLNIQETPIEEKKACIQALLSIKENFTPPELSHLVSNSRASMRQLAVEYFEQKLEPMHVSYLYPLLFDSNPEVAARALYCYGLLGIQKHKGDPLEEKFLQLLNNPHPDVQLAAAWTLARFGVQKGKTHLRFLLADSNPYLSARAAAAVTKLGVEGISIAKEEILKASSPYVRLNLAMGLIGQRVELEESAKILREVLKKKNEKWMQEPSLFAPIVPSYLTHKPEVPYFPEVVDQALRLELVSLLSVVSYPEALELLKELFKDRKGEAAGMASQLLLGIGDDVALEMVYDLLEDSDPKVRLEAALVIGLGANDHEVVDVLIQAYPTQKKDNRIKILEALGKIGDKKALPFLIEKLKDPSLNTRLIAAAMLLVILKH